MFDTVKINTDVWIPVILQTDAGVGVDGKVFGDITVRYYKCDGTEVLTAYTVTTAEWKEKKLTGTGYGGYNLLIGAGEFTSTGKWEIMVSCAGCKDYNYPVEVLTYVQEDHYSGYNVIEKWKHIDVSNDAGNALDLTSPNHKGINIDSDSDCFYMRSEYGTGIKILSVNGGGIDIDGDDVGIKVNSRLNDGIQVDGFLSGIVSYGYSKYGLHCLADQGEGVADIYAPNSDIRGITLAASSITSSTYDETTAFPVKSADSGSSQIARTGANGDTLESLSDEIAAVKSDTGTLGGIGDEVSLVYADTTNIVGTGVKLSATGKTDVNTEVVDVLYTDTITELGITQPPKNPTLAQAVMFAYMTSRNEHEQSATLFTVKNDAGTVVAKADLINSGTSIKLEKFVAGDA